MNRRRNYYQYLVNKKEYKYLIKIADERGYEIESYDTFKEIYDFEYRPTFGTIRIASQGSKILIFCQIYHLVDIEDFEAPWKVYTKKGWAVFVYDRRTPNENADTMPHSITPGWMAFRDVMRQIRKNYTEEEIIANLEQYQEYYRISPIRESIYKDGEFFLNNSVLEYTDSHYYDLNKAYAAMVMKAFPKIRPWVIKGYKKNKAKMKNTMNYFVGMLVNKESYLQEDLFPQFRNWIMNQINELMYNAIDITSGDSITNFMDTLYPYINTDGFIVSRPVALLSTTDEIGDFKEEPIDNGKVWTYRHQAKDNDDEDRNYTILQYFENGEKVIKVIGGFRLEDSLMQQTDLSKGIIPTFGFEEIAGLHEVKEDTIKWQTVQIEKIN